MADVKPILFSAPMVRALIEGRKTQTRRVLKPQPECSSHEYWPDAPDFEPRIDDDGLHCGVCGGGLQLAHHRKSGVKGIPVPYEVGDLLWVRETWQAINSSDGPQLSYRATPDYFPIDAWDGPDEGVGPSFNYDRCPGGDFSVWGADLLGSDGPWCPSIHMPRWASRLTLEVTGVKVERLQDISEADALAEGVCAFHHGDGAYYYSALHDGPHPKNWCDPTDAFRELWNHINGAGAWDANPWVCAVTFTVHKQNIDALIREREQQAA